MKKGWTLKTFDEIGKITNGNSINEKIKEEKYTSFTDGLAYIATKDISYDSKINYLNGIIIPNEDLKNFKIAKINSLLICSEGGSAGRKFAMTNQDICFVNKLFAVETKKDVIPKILLYYFNSSIFQNEFKERLTGLIGGVSINKFKTIPIPVAPLSEQHAIVEKLDFAFDAIEKAKANIEKNIENAKELFQSKLNAIFSQKGEGWEEKKLKEMGKVQTGTTPKTAESDNYGDFIPFIKPADFKKDGSIVSKGSSLSEKGLKSGRLIDENSALMVCIGATIGKTGYTLMPVTCNQQINAITPTKYFNYKFIYYGLISNDFITKVLSEGKGAQATLPIINKSKWENLTMNITHDLIKQEQIVSQLDLLSNQTNLLQEKYKQKLANLEELKKSILEKAFKGELI